MPTLLLHNVFTLVFVLGYGTFWAYLISRITWEC